MFVDVNIGLGIREEEFGSRITEAMTYPTFSSAANVVKSTVTDWSDDVTPTTITNP